MHIIIIIDFLLESVYASQSKISLEKAGDIYPDVRIYSNVFFSVHIKVCDGIQ